MILTCDTSHRRGSLGLVKDGGLIEERHCEPVAEKLMPTLRDLLAAHDCELGQISLYAVVSGPGSFTGLRIGLSAIKTLALMQQKPAVGVSTLEALAHGAHRLAGDSRDMRQRPLAALAHASGEDFFVCMYGAAQESGEFHGRVCVLQEQILAAAQLREHLTPDCLLIGEAAELFSSRYLDHPASAIRRVAPATPQALDIAALALRYKETNDWKISATSQPRYLRLSAAEQRRGKASI